MHLAVGQQFHVHHFQKIVAFAQSIIGREIREQLMSQEFGKIPETYILM